MEGSKFLLQEASLFLSNLLGRIQETKQNCPANYQPGGSDEGSVQTAERNCEALEQLAKQEAPEYRPVECRVGFISKPLTV